MHQNSVRPRPWVERQLLPKELIHVLPTHHVPHGWELQIVPRIMATEEFVCVAQVVKELLAQGADPNLPLTKGLGTALCVVCDLFYEQQRTTENKIALVRGGMGGCWGRGSGWRVPAGFRVG